MTGMRLTNPFRPHRAAHLTHATSATSPTPPDPMDENALAIEIARIMERRTSPSHQSAHDPQQRWLGDEQDRAIVEGYQSQPESLTLSDAPTATKFDAQAAAGQGDQTFLAAHEEPAVAYASGTAARWVRQARRDRFRMKLRDAAGWTVSLAVSLILVAAVGLAMYGWPSANRPIRQIEVKPLDMSAIRATSPTTGVRDFSPASTRSAELEALRQ